MRNSFFYKLLISKKVNSKNFLFKFINVVTHVYNSIISFCANLNIRYFYNKKLKNLNIFPRNNKIIVSFTTVESRINFLPLMLKSIFNQTMMPDKIILWISNEGDAELKAKNLLVDYIKKGLEIIPVKDIKVHTKYYYAFKKFPNDLIITIDDDIIYDEKTIEVLYDTYLSNSKCVVANRCHEIVMENSCMKKYNQWNFLAPGKIDDVFLFATGVGGILYPPNCLYKDWDNIDLFLNLTSNADDIWLKVMEFLNDIKVKKVNKYTKEVIIIKDSQDVALSKQNVINERNDIYIKNCLKYYNLRNFVIKENENE